MSILQKVEKLISHEVSARQLGSIAEADAFAAKVRQILLDHKLERTSSQPGAQASTSGRAVTAEQAGISSRRTRQEWSERLASSIAEAFHCELVLQKCSNTVVFRGRDLDRAAAAGLYADLAQKAVAACGDFFIEWKRRRPTYPGSTRPEAGTSAYSRRWKQSFLLGFAQTISQRFTCDHNCLRQCQHTSQLVRIDGKPECPAHTLSGRPIGGHDLLYDALYRGRAAAAMIVLDLDHCAA